MAVGGHTDIDAAQFGVFRRIRQQIGHNGGDDLRVEVDGWKVGADAVHHLHILVVVEFLEVEHDFLHEAPDVAPCHGESAVLRLGLPEFKNLVDEVAQPLGTLADVLQLTVGGGWQVVRVDQVFERTEDERQGSPQLVCDIGEEPQPFLIEFLFLHVLHAGHLE